MFSNPQIDILLWYGTLLLLCALWSGIRARRSLIRHDMAFAAICQALDQQQPVDDDMDDERKFTWLVATNWSMLSCMLCGCGLGILMFIPMIR